MIDIVSAPWHWAFSGFAISMVMLLLLMAGQRFGISSSFRTVCAMFGAGKYSEYFRYEMKRDGWLLFFVVGTMAGGFVASHYLGSKLPVQISSSTTQDLAELGIIVPTMLEEGQGYVPMELFEFSALTDAGSLSFLVIGGLLIGFGTRWAGGCTSGHAISGLSNFQLPSLIAVIGFFIGGLAMTHFLFPLIF